MPSRRNVRRLATLIVGTMLGALAPTVALAQPAAPVNETYKAHMENGIKLFQDKNYGAATSEFKAAYDAHPKASPLVNMALCYKAEFKYPKAIQALEKALKEHGDSMDANDKRAAEDAITEMRGLLAYVTVKVTQNAGVILVDGEDVAQIAAPTPPSTVSSTQIAIGPGTHKVGVRLDGFDRQETEVTVASGTKDKIVAFTLIANSGWISVQTPGRGIVIDNKPVGRDAYKGFLVPGFHEIIVDGDPKTQVLAIAGQPIYLKQGQRGLVVYPAQPQMAPSSGPPVTQPPKKVDPPKPPEPEVPVVQRKGFYVLGGVNIVWPLTHAKDDVDTHDGGFDLNGGWSGQLFGGYRVNNNAGFQLLLDYQNIFSPASTTTDSAATRGYTESTFHLGGGVRLMTGGKTVRLVGDLNGGLAIDTLTLSNLPTLKSALNLKNTTKLTSAQGFVVGDGGLEIDLNGVLLDGCGGFGVQTTRGTGPPNASFSEPLVTFSIGLRVGYAFWK